MTVVKLLTDDAAPAAAFAEMVGMVYVAGTKVWATAAMPSHDGPCRQRSVGEPCRRRRMVWAWLSAARGRKRDGPGLEQQRDR